jgi:lipopolysaccharide/colanic/teichoic acid biosynthesis glycosyltransferase
MWRPARASFVTGPDLFAGTKRQRQQRWDQRLRELHRFVIGWSHSGNHRLVNLSPGRRRGPRRRVSGAIGRSLLVSMPERERYFLVDRDSSQRAPIELRELPLRWTADTTRSARGQKDVLKRCFDIAMVLLLGIPILPLAVVMAIAVRAESSGPIFYRALRVGKHGRLFGCLKFRSMYHDADARLKHLLDEDPRIRAEYECHHKLHCDPRITAVGKILRRFSLDELPQLWNVLKGDMSIIGPRPYNAAEVPELGDHARIIQQVRPGLTGLWQVSGRAKTSFAERVALETTYVSHRSLRLDLCILIQTIRVVLSGDGAY